MARHGGRGRAPPTTTKPAEAGIPSDDGSGSSSGPSAATPSPSTTSPATSAPTTATATTATPATTTAATSASKNGSTTGSIDGDTASGGTNSTGGSTDHSSSTSSSGGRYGVVIGVVLVAAVVLLALVYVVRRHRSKKDDADKELRRRLDALDVELGESADAAGSGSSYHAKHSPASYASSRTTAHGSDRDSLGSIWKHPEILAARLPFEKLRVRELISRGGFGEVFHGVYHDQHVAIKRLLPENRRRMASLEDFLKEAQLLSVLDHERIVAFVGVAWDSPRDLCLVLEYMANGDLRSVLSQWRQEGGKTGWQDVRKVRIALHVAEALTYLHTLTPKVVHRDLKSKNVLLDEHWAAKVSDFGASREESTHNTMTANVGSSLWIAPEVMMGNNYDEKADVFSFGVVLSELDSLQLPYHNATTPDGRKLPDAAVLHLVTMGKMQAEFGSMSRTDIVLLGRACLALDPAQRPSAAEVRYRLSQILGSY